VNGVHDLGGMHGFGPIEREADEPRFHADWEAHVFAILVLSINDQGYFHWDAMRYGIELMEPAHYLRSTYYERWLASAEHNFIQAGFVTGDEVDARTEFLRRHPATAVPRRDDATPRPRASEGSPALPLPPPEPRFAVGDAVVARNVHPTGHTRLPRYARGKRGVIHLVHGPTLLPDTNAQGLGEHPQVVYSVRFDGRELWGDSAEPRQAVYLDLWDSYLDPAPE
jgi:nitrile hydratase subunit beta